MNHKFQIGQKVVYDGLIATIESKHNYTDGRPCYGLVADENEELTCIADEAKCELYNGEDIDQREALREACVSSTAIQETVALLTDKHFRDGNH